MQYESERYQEIVESLIDRLWDYSELAFEEHRSVQALTEALRDHGYKTELGVGGLPTAFRAVYGHGKPVIGLLAEYDALDGLSQEANCVEYRPRPETTHGHGCGHHLLGSGIVGAALVLKDYLDQNPGVGTVAVIGCPAEESGCGKTFMARAGVFDDLDIALTWHPSSMNAAMTGSLLANCKVFFRFHGVSAHAGAAPEKGRSALDAVELMNVGVNYLREHMAMTDRIHYAVTNTGGRSPNVVQSEAEVVYLIRSKTTKSVQELYRRVVNIAKGAALMTETRMELEFDGALSNVVPSDTLGQLMYDKMVQLGTPEYSDEERQYIAAFRQVIGDEAANHDLGMLPEFDLEERQALCEAHPMGDFVLPFLPKDVVETASSDMGDVSHIAPLIQLQCACFCLGTPPHSVLEVAQGRSSYAKKGALFAAQVLCDAAKELFENPDLVSQAQEENRRRIGPGPYVCPIPAEVLPRPFRK